MSLSRTKSGLLCRNNRITRSRARCFRCRFLSCAIPTRTVFFRLQYLYFSKQYVLNTACLARHGAQHDASSVWLRSKSLSDVVVGQGYIIPYTEDGRTSPPGLSRVCVGIVWKLFVTVTIVATFSLSCRRPLQQQRKRQQQKQQQQQQQQQQRRRQQHPVRTAEQRRMYLERLHWLGSKWTLGGHACQWMLSRLLTSDQGRGDGGGGGGARQGGDESEDTPGGGGGGGGSSSRCLSRLPHLLGVAPVGTEYEGVWDGMG